MKIKFFCPLWGSENLDTASFFAKVKNSGYDGVEMGMPKDQNKKEEILLLLKQFDLQLIGQHSQTSTANFSEHKKEFRQWLENLADCNPLFINTQTGKDFFTYEQNAELIQVAKEVSENYGIKIVHETHRGKFSFAAHITKQFLANNPDLRIAFDVSHWCNVAESYLADQPEAVEIALSRTDHIHARIGFPEGPQIPDPRDTHWHDALDFHVGCWNKVIEQRKKEGWTEFTITPEFGPYPYMTILPNTHEPIADQWAINHFMKEYLKTALK